MIISPPSGSVLCLNYYLSDLIRFVSLSAQSLNVSIEYHVFTDYPFPNLVCWPSRSGPIDGWYHLPYLPPMPGKLVKKVQSGMFVDMMKILSDNVSTSKTWGDFFCSATTSLPVKLQDIPDILTWVTASLNISL